MYDSEAFSAATTACLPLRASAYPDQSFRYPFLGGLILLSQSWTGLVRLASVVLFAVNIGMVFQGLDVSRNFSWHPQLGSEAFFQHSCQAMCLANRCQAWEQQM